MAKVPSNSSDSENQKNEQLNQHREKSEGKHLTTNDGVKVNHTDDSLKAGERGPTLMEDFHFREKMTHFDHERIPERVVHARGSGAHGYFQCYEPIPELTKAKLFQNPDTKTPVFVRFSTVAGFRGSADTVRDVRGFATKFYTEDGNWDLVGNNMPVFFVQDGIKFPDFIHAVKPEPHHEMPQAASAHDNFWDFISLVPESLHMIMWVMSDRAFPRSYAMMEGFGVHTFRFINEEGKARFVKFHWKPLAGTHSLIWDEVQKIGGKDPDFNRRDLWESIEAGIYPEYELGVQIVEEEDEHKFDFDLLDPTKIIPEEMVPVRKIGKMTLNRNPDNFFAETEQVAFHPGHVVPGIDFTNDPLLQGRLFSYIDTQLIRLGGPNFHEIPINRPVAEVHNNQRDGYMRQTINRGRANYFPNTTGGGCPMTAPENMGGYVHYMEKVDGRKIRGRSESFRDFYSQARLFWKSQTETEKKHIVQALHFELGKVMIMDIRKRVVEHLHHIDKQLAADVAIGIGLKAPQNTERIEKEVSDVTKAIALKKDPPESPALSLENTNKDSIKGRKIAVLLDEGFDHQSVKKLKEALKEQHAMVHIISQFYGMKKGTDHNAVEADRNHTVASSVLYDAVFVAAGKDSVAKLKKQSESVLFINEAYKHYKPIAGIGEGAQFIKEKLMTNINISENDQVMNDMGVVTLNDFSDMEKFVKEFTKAIAKHRHWGREGADSIPV
jgi:catalase